MPLTREQIIQKELDYFKSDLATEPAYLTVESQLDDYDEFSDSYPEDKCVYKTPDGKKCAVGALIKPAHYDPSFDADNGTPVSRLSDEVINYLGVDNIEWLGRLQTCHDDCARNWYQGEGYTGVVFGGHFGRYFLQVAKDQRLLS
jgi:hypothetical protein